MGGLCFRLDPSTPPVQRTLTMTIVPMHDRIEHAVKVLQIQLLLAAITLASSGIAASNSGSDWLRPAREAPPTPQIKKQLDELQAKLYH